MLRSRNSSYKTIFGWFGAGSISAAHSLTRIEYSQLILVSAKFVRPERQFLAALRS